ncbi:helix-turn-helix transcriptional regulator [Marinobacterium jannaschii]|uniref:helix-turn-helix transcriptional regulator n=1 Tax=Marinobacterium jannaschii TaxID=64970 RepID=UPI00055D490D|nr:AraC family transcriptional regulator [Marinobacterium jannaschii]
MSAPTVYQIIEESGAQLVDSLTRGSELAAAIWERDDYGPVSYQKPGHHTLSCYLEGGVRMRRLFQRRAMGGGAPGRICVMPADQRYDWDVSGHVRLFHLYFSDQQLKTMAERVLDRESAHLALDDRTFVADPWIHQICMHGILQLDWHDRADQLAISSLNDSLINYLLKHYSNSQVTLPECRGGLAPAVRRLLSEYIESHLDRALTLHSLASLAHLSEYHFARMFKVSFGEPPHQYVNRRRLVKASMLLQHAELSISEIALQCGFSSQSHFSHRFRQGMGITPGRYRRSKRETPVSRV